MDLENSLINYKILSQIENDIILSPVNQVLDKKERQKQDLVDMLQNMLKENFDSKLSNLENNSREQISTINNTLLATKYITNLSLKMQKEIKETFENKEKKTKENLSKTSKISKKSNITQNYTSPSKFSEKLSKTPSRAFSNKSIFSKSINNNLFNRMQKDKNKTPGYALKLTKKTFDSTEIITKQLFSSREARLTTSYNTDKTNYKFSSLVSPRKNNIIKKNIYSSTNRKKSHNIKLNKNFEDLSKRSVMSNDTHYGYMATEDSKSMHSKKSMNSSRIKNVKKSHNIHNIQNISNSKSPRKKNGTTTVKSKFEKTEKNANSKKKVFFKTASKEKILIKLEGNLEKEENKINNDPLLISSLKDFELNSNLIRYESNIVLNKNKKNNNNLSLSQKKENEEKSLKSKYECSFFADYNILNEYLNNILIFLSIKDILEIKRCSKTFDRSVIDYLIKVLGNERTKFFEKQNELNLSVNEIPPKFSVDDINLTKGSIKALNLLNEEILNRLFFEDKEPNKEVFIVYKIYFQLIKHKEITKYINNDKTNDNIFWEKCKNYFKEFNGKTGDCINKVITQKKINIDGDNIYKIYKIINKDINKLIPSYFSKICGTTGLFIFFIKDILDFLGFSSDKKIQKNAYWSYSEIINSIDGKIKILNEHQKY